MRKDDELIKWGTHELKRGRSYNWLQASMLKEGVRKSDANRILKRVEVDKAVSDEKSAAAQKISQEKAPKDSAAPAENKPSGGFFIFIILLIVTAIAVYLLYNSGKLSLEMLNMKNFK